ncbi:MAG: hypothetical protein ACI9VR_004515 [Cognaticolwellia sp.]|jgi:hypothetical protein
MGQGNQGLAVHLEMSQGDDQNMVQLTARDLFGLRDPRQGHRREGDRREGHRRKRPGQETSQEKGEQQHALELMPKTASSIQAAVEQMEQERP